MRSKYCLYFFDSQKYSSALHNTHNRARQTNMCPTGASNTFLLRYYGTRGQCNYYVDQNEIWAKPLLRKSCYPNQIKCFVACRCFWRCAVSLLQQFLPFSLDMNPRCGSNEINKVIRNQNRVGQLTSATKHLALAPMYQPTWHEMIKSHRKNYVRCHFATHKRTTPKSFIDFNLRLSSPLLRTCN